MKQLGIVVAFVSVVAFRVAYEGFAVSRLWAWFVVPSFSVPQLSVPAAVGVSLIALVIGSHSSDTKEKAEDPPFEELLARAVGRAAGVPSAALLIGWIACQFM